MLQPFSTMSYNYEQQFGPVDVFHKELLILPGAEAACQNSDLQLGAEEYLLGAGIRPSKVSSLASTDLLFLSPEGTASRASPKESESNL